MIRLLVLHILFLGVRFSDCDTQATEVIEDILQNSGDMTMAQIFREIDKSIASLDVESKMEHLKWVKAWKAEENRRLGIIRDAIAQLRRPLQARLVRIAMIHQNPNLTLNEKRHRLYRIQDAMDPYTRERLEELVPPSILFSLLV